MADASGFDGQTFAFAGGDRTSREILQAHAEEILRELAEFDPSDPNSEQHAMGVEAAVACGFCRLFGGQAPAAPFPNPLGIIAASHLVRLIDAATTKANELPGAWDAALPEEAEDLVADLLQVRMKCWAALETLDAIVNERGGNATLADGFDEQLTACDEAVARFDQALVDRLDFLATLTDTELLNNWRLSLAEEYREPLPWWLDGTLEEAATVIDADIVEMQRDLLPRPPRNEPARPASHRIRDRLMQMYAAAADVPQRQFQLTPLCQWISPSGEFSASLLPPENGPQIDLDHEKLVLLFRGNGGAPMDALRDCVAVLGGHAAAIIWRSSERGSIPVAEFPAAAVIEAEAALEASAADRPRQIQLTLLPERVVWNPD